MGLPLFAYSFIFPFQSSPSSPNWLRCTPLLIATFCLFGATSSSALMLDDPMPPCAKPGMDIGMKSGAALGGLGSTVYRIGHSLCGRMLFS